MGTQQILLIVLGVIIIGAAMTVGLHLFIEQTYSSNQQALAVEIQGFALRAVQWYKVPEAIGGAGLNPANLTVAHLASYLGFSGPNESTSSENGSYRLVSVSGFTAQIEGTGLEIKRGRHPYILSTINLSNGSITAAISSVP